MSKVKLRIIQIWKRIPEKIRHVITVIVLSFLAALSVVLFVLFVYFPFSILYFYYYFLQFIYTLSLFPPILLCLILILGILLIYFSKRRKIKCNHKQRTSKPNPKLTYKILGGVLGTFLLVEFITPVVTLWSAGSKIDTAIIDARSLLKSHNASIEHAVQRVTNFVDREVKNSYRRPFESMFEIDNLLGPLNYYILNLFGFERAHVVVFQGWGSCGQYAIVTEYMLRNLGFDTRRARFIDRDHAWAEIRINGTWFIVDSWFIAHSFNNSILVPAQLLATVEKFKADKGVLVTYPNGTITDASPEHGYAP